MRTRSLFLVLVILLAGCGGGDVEDDRVQLDEPTVPETRR